MMKKMLILVLAGVMLWACNKKETEKVEELQDSTTMDTASPTLNTIVLPDQLGECSCKMAATEADYKQGKYLYADDYGNTAYVKINGEDFVFNLDESFDLENFERILENEKYMLHIKNKNVKTQEEMHIYRGEIILTNKQTSKETVTAVYAQCGC